MKRILCLTIVFILIATLISCSRDKNQSDTPITDITDSTDTTVQPDEDVLNPDLMSTPCTKENVDEFMSALGEVYADGLYGGIKLEYENCYNVTPTQVADQTNIRIFKFSDTCASFALIDNEVYEICNSFGGYGFVNAVPINCDGDGNRDLLIASSWGSGMHRSEISVFSTQTKESTVIYDTSSTDKPDTDLIVVTESPSFSSVDFKEVPIYYTVYSANIKTNGNNLADLSYAVTGVVGSVDVENEEPIFKPSEESFLFTKAENGNIVSPFGIEYAFLANETEISYLGELEFAGAVKGEDKTTEHLGSAFQTGMYSIKNSKSDTLLVRCLPSNEWYSIYRLADLPEFDISIDNCIKLELVFDTPYTDKREGNTPITDKNEIAAFLSDIRSQKSPEEAGLYELVRKEDGSLENCYRLGAVYGYFEEEADLAVTLSVTSYNDLAYSVDIDGVEYVLPDKWVKRLQTA